MDHHAAIERAIQQAGGPENIRFVAIAPEALAMSPLRFSGTIEAREVDGLVELLLTRD